MRRDQYNKAVKRGYGTAGPGRTMFTIGLGAFAVADYRDLHQAPDDLGLVVRNERQGGLSSDVPSRPGILGPRAGERDVIEAAPHRAGAVEDEEHVGGAIGAWTGRTGPLS